MAIYISTVLYVVPIVSPLLYNTNRNQSHRPFVYTGLHDKLNDNPRDALMLLNFDYHTEIDTACTRVVWLIESIGTTRSNTDSTIKPKGAVGRED